MQSADQENLQSPKVDRLVLHHSSPSHSLSSPSPSERGVRLGLEAEHIGLSLGLQRPKTARGGPVCTSINQAEDDELPIHKYESTLEEEPRWRLRKEKERGESQKEDEDEEEEERKRSEREKRSLRERNEEIERERRKADWEVEEEKERLIREKQKRMCLLQEELRREEEEEEKKLREESEERLR